MASGMTGRVFQASGSVSVILGTKVGVEVLVGCGVIGVYFLGFGVAVDCARAAGATARAGNVCVGRLTGPLTGIGTEVTSPLQEAINAQVANANTRKRFIRTKYIG